MKYELPEGVRVYVTHFRKYPGLKGYWTKADVAMIDSRKPLAKTGYTEAILLDKDNNFLADGLAKCGKRDNFCYRIGRDIAIGRALKNLRSTQS